MWLIRLIVLDMAQKCALSVEVVSPRCHIHCRDRGMAGTSYSALRSMVLNSMQRESQRRGTSSSSEFRRVCERVTQVVSCTYLCDRIGINNLPFGLKQNHTEHLMQMRLHSTPQRHDSYLTVNDVWSLCCWCDTVASAVPKCTVEPD